MQSIQQRGRDAACKLPVASWWIIAPDLSSLPLSGPMLSQWDTLLPFMMLKSWLNRRTVITPLQANVVEITTLNSIKKRQKGFLSAMVFGQTIQSPPTSHPR